MARSAPLLAVFTVMALAAASACGGGDGDADADGDGDGDTDVDGDADADGDADTDGDTDADADGDTDADTDGDGDSDAGPDECAAGEAVCLDHVTRRYCDDSGSATRWREEACPAGSGCVRGACVVGECSDGCNLGDTDGARSCELYDLDSGEWRDADPAGSLVDRARAYNMWLRRDGMSHGGVGNARYSDPPEYTNVVGLGGIGDSAIWTGTYLAAEALRLRETGSADARQNVEALVETLHLWFNVAGQPGLLSRFAAPAGDHPLVHMDCAERRIHCGVEHEGTLYDYSGHISRDQYQGVMLGYALAYEALGETGETHRALIREDVLELLDELMAERDVRIRVSVDGTALPPFDMHMRFVVLAPAEMTDGAVDLILDTADYDDSEMLGFQEFTPNLAHIVRQIPLMSWVPDIPRSGSAIMLSSFFRVGLLVTDDVPGHEADHAALLDYYLHADGQGGNVEDWLDIARVWTDTRTCGEKYYGNNIAMEPMYNWARLEDDILLRDAILFDVLERQMWDNFVNTKNPFFSFIYAGNVDTHDPAVPVSALEQLAQFPPPPRVRVARDWRTDPRYMPHEEGCTDQVHHGTAVDVGDRCVSDFIWQRQPWGLLCSGDPAATEPGVDYLVAYWMGRWHDFIDDDAPGSCLAWRE